VLISIADFLRAIAEKNDERVEAIAAGFSHLPSGQAGDVLEELKSLSDSPEVDTRWWATRAIAALSNPQVPQLLMRSLEDENTTIRQCAALGLRIHQYVQAIPALVTALADKDALVARLASDALANVGEAAVPALLEVIGTGSQAARLEAVRALAHIGDQRSIPNLIAVLDEDSALMDYWATEGLERMGVGLLLFAPE
jgi:HEAT repeat protein